MFGRKGRGEKQLAQQGSQAMAEILSADQGVVAVTHGADTVVGNTELSWKLTLRVAPAGGSPFEAELKGLWPQLSPPQVGTIVPVRYDPADTSRVVLDQDPEALRRANAQFASGLVKTGMLQSGRSAADADAVASDEFLAETGTLAKAIVKQVTDTGKTGAYDSHELELQLDVTMPDGSAYAATLRKLVGPMAMWRYTAGSAVNVAVDPNDHTRAVVASAIRH
jgi:hypothetical protein